MTPLCRNLGQEEAAMAVHLTCQCGAQFDLKDEFAGKKLRCPKCGATLQAPAATASGLDPAFQRNKFLLRQKALAITAEKYYVFDEAGNAIMYVERPAHVLRTLLAVAAGIVAALVTATVLGVIAAMFDKGPGFVIFVVLTVLGAPFALFAVAIAISAKRHVTFYRDDTRLERLLDILQHRKLNFIRAAYTVRDAQEKPLAVLQKNYLYNIFRKRWYCYRPDGSVLCLIKEDSLVLSLLRRFLGPLFGALRTNFIFLTPEGEMLGEFNRKFTILDRYVLDMTHDRKGAVDRRIAAAAGVMLDTGEHR
jgi:hypothetical protein